MATTRVPLRMAAAFFILLLGMGSPLTVLAEDEASTAPAAEDSATSKQPAAQSGEDGDKVASDEGASTSEDDAGATAVDTDKPAPSEGTSSDGDSAGAGESRGGAGGAPPQTVKSQIREIQEVLDAGGSSPEPTAADARTQLTALGFSGQPFATAEQLTNLAENSTPKSEYDRCYQVIAEDGKDDGRGYTCYGLVGVTTKNGDALEMVERYTAERSDNPLAKYLPVLRQKADDATPDAERGSLSGLEGFPEAWAATAKDPAFRQVQDDIRDQRYTGPALTAVQQVGLRTNLGFASMYDASVMHGSSTDPSDPEYGDSLNALVQRATARAGGTPASSKVTEAQWLKSFYDVREADLRNPVNKDTQSVWSEAVDRVEVYRKLLQQGNTELRRPLKVRVNGDNFRLE